MKVLLIDVYNYNMCLSILRIKDVKVTIALYRYHT